MTEHAHPNTDVTQLTSPPNSAESSRIVVGVDGSEGSLAALTWAVHETRLRGGTLRVVMAWQMPQAFGSANVWGLGMDPSLDAETVLAEAAAKEADRLSADVDPGGEASMRWEAVEGHPAWALIGAAESADLLVVGSRGHGGFVGALLGSVSQHVVTHAGCPVVVIPHPQHAAETRTRGSSFREGVYGQAHDHVGDEHGQGVYEQGHDEPAGTGVFDQGQQEAGEGIYEQGRPNAEDV